MYISIQKSGKNKQNAYVKLMESYRVAGQGTKHRVVKNYGRLDVLLKADPQALEKLKAQFANEGQNKKDAQSALRVEQLQKDVQIASGSSEDGIESPVLNYGYLVLKRLWDDLLRLPAKIRYDQKQTDFKIDLNRAISYLTFTKVLDPSSILCCYGYKDGFVGNPLGEMTLDNLYSSYDFLKRDKDAIFSLLNDRLDEEYGSDRSTLIFYDVTNCYFEAAMTDAERGYEQKDYLDKLTEIVRDYIAQGKIPKDCLSADEMPVEENFPQWLVEEIAAKKIQYMRMRGPSKEHRFDLPLVSIALVIDKNGMPMDFTAYAGNVSEFKGMKESIEALKKKYHIDETIVVADRGLNSATNLKMLNDEMGMGYLMAQRVDNLPADTKALMLNKALYRPIDPEHPDLGSYQKIDHWKKPDKTNKEGIDCTLVLTFSESRRARDEAILDNWLSIARAKLSNGEKIKRKNSGWASLVKTGEKTKGTPILGIDEKEVQRKRSLCGFAAMVYHPAPDKDAEQDKQDKSIEKVTDPQWSAGNIAGVYHQLNQIEECFRIMKSNLGLRPMYVWNSDHIQGHITVCVLALLLIRILQKRLRANGKPMTIDGICQTLNDMNVTVSKAPDGDVLFTPVRRYRNLRQGYERLKTSELIELIRSGKVNIRQTADLMRAADLTPLPGRLVSRGEFSRCVRTRMPTPEEAVSKIWLDLL